MTEDSDMKKIAEIFNSSSCQYLYCMHNKKIMVTTHGLEAKMKLCCPVHIIGEESSSNEYFMYLYERTTSSEVEHDCKETTKMFKNSIVDPSWNTSLREWYNSFDSTRGFEECSHSISQRSTTHKSLLHCYATQQNVEKNHISQKLDNDSSTGRGKVILNKKDCETKNNFYEIGFVERQKKWFPVIELSPADVPFERRNEEFLKKYENENVSY